MTRMFVVYRTPEDPAAFDKHYFNVHIALSKGLPGLLSYEVSEGAAITMGSASDAYRVAILTFQSMETLKAAFESKLGRACAADRQLMSPDEKVQMFLFDDRPV